MQDPGDTIFPFGKFKGEKIRDIPNHYLDWCLSIELRPWLRTAIESYLARQADYEPAPANPKPKDWREGREDYTGED